MATIQIDDQVANDLIQRAEAEGVTVSDLIRTLVQTAAKQDLLPVEQFDAELDKVAMPGPTLPADFSRADIYNEHD